MKKFICVLILICLALPAWSAEKGKLTVVTDLGNDATIYVGGKLVGRDAIQAYPVEAGDHYVTVWYRGKKCYAKTLTITAGQYTTVSSAHFVDLRTSTASRGAIDVEAARLRESRGNMAFGLYTGGPASGLSWKWWFFEKLGLQAVGFLSSSGNDQTQNQVGGRLLIHFADKVMNETTITAYLAAGGGTHYAKQGDNADTTLIGEGALGIELGFLNLYWSLELGAEKRVVTHTQEGAESTTDLSNMKASGGLHYYF